MSVISTLNHTLPFKPNMAGQLGLFPIEIVNQLWQFLPLHDLIQYGNTSGVNQLHVQDFVRHITNDKIRAFFDDPRGLQNLLWHTNSIISRSVALACLFPFELCNWCPRDMDIYTTEAALPRVLDYLISKEYRIVSGDSRNASHYASPNSIRLVIKLTNNKGQTIDLIVADLHSSLTVIFEY
jgi:hypothetical protein